MSGICGFLDWRGAYRETGVAEHALQRMFDASRHLGPEGTARFADDFVGLGQFLDWQTPEEVGLDSVQRHAESRTALVADARLDNRDELIENLGLGIDAVGWSDARLLLCAYEKWGARFAERLLGDFFCALWEERNGRLHLVRDPLGMRPAYYYVTEHGVLFGSDVRTIAAHPAFERKLCRTRVADYVGLAFEDSEITFYEGLMRLPPGTMLSFHRAGVERRVYWDLQLTPELKLQDNRAYTERFRELLVESVRCRLRANGRVGFLLSGGLDSSSIVGIARCEGLAAKAGPLRTFSALFPDYPGIDERSYIDEVLATGSFAPTFVRVDRGSPLANVPKEIEDHGQPFYAPNNYVDSALLDAAQSSGIRTVLDGLDGDTTVGHGWEFLGELLRRGKWRRLWRLARALDRHTDKSAFWFIWRHALGPTGLGLLTRWQGRRAIRPPALMSEALVREVSWRDRVWSWRQHRGFDLLSNYREQHWGKLKSGLMPMCFEIASHQAGVRSMVRRHPYFDRRLVEFCVSLPADQRLDRGVDRMIQRRAVEGFTPEAIRTRLTKSIWVQNFADRLAVDERGRLTSWLTRSSPVAEFVDMKTVRDNCKKILSGTASERVLAEFWVVVGLDVWLTARWCPDPVLGRTHQSNSIANKDRSHG